LTPDEQHADLSVAILGCGKQAHKHVQGWQAIDGVELAVADLDEERARALGEEANVDWSTDPDELVERKDVDAVDVCTPTPTHPKLILRAMDEGKDFFCEKPLTDSLASAQRIRDRLEETNTVGMVGYIYRFAPAFQALDELLSGHDAEGHSPELGPLVHAQFRIGGTGSHRAWKHESGSGGGVFNEMLVHLLDLAIWYFGPVKEVEVLEREFLRPTREIAGEEVSVDADDHVVVTARMANGLKVLFQADMVTPWFDQWVQVEG
jgi:predicted dehydrogenase